MDTETINMFSQFGLAGAVIVVLVVQVRYLQSKLVTIIEENTRALVELRAVISACQMIHSKGVDRE